MILINTTNSKTPVSLVNNKPDLTAYSEPTKSILQKAFDDGNYTTLSESSTIYIPREIDARRLRLALLQLGHLEKVKNAVSTLGEEAYINWEFATVIREDNPLTIALSSQLNLDIDLIFKTAEQIQ